MYNIGIIEIACDNHEVSDLCKFSVPEKNNITLFTTEDMLPRIRMELGDYASQIEFCIKEETESYRIFLTRISKMCSNGFDLIIINSLRRWEFLYFRPDCKVLAYLYSLNFWFKDLQSERIIVQKMLNMRNLLYWKQSQLHSNPFLGPVIRKRQLNRIDGVLVEYPSLVDLIRRTFGYQRPVYFLPKRCFENREDLSGRGKVTFVITGSITTKRRDYGIVFNALQSLSDNVKSKIKLELVGSPEKLNNRILRNIQKLKNAGIDIYYPKEFIPFDVFTKRVQAADIFISPIKLNYRSVTVTERYTYTKGSGTFNDSIRFGKASIVPVEYNIAPGFEACFKTYRDQVELCGIISELTLYRHKLNQLKEEALNTMKKYSITNVKESFEKITADFFSKCD